MSKPDPRVPADLFIKYGFEPDKFFKSDHKSARGPCPRCPGSHRSMVVFLDHPPNCNFECICGYKGVMFSSGRRDPEAARLLEERIAREEALRRRQATRKLETFRRREDWLTYHVNLDAKRRVWWLRRGIPGSWQDFWKLGYIHDRVFEHDGEFFHSPAYTIPCFDLGWAAVNIHYRITQLPEGMKGKYRQEAGLLPGLFFSRPDLPIGDGPIVVEGAIKAAVTCIKLPGNPQVIAVPAALSWAGLVERVKDCRNVWVMLDRDAQAAASKLVAEIGPTAHNVLPPLANKPDDALLFYGATPQHFRQAFRRALAA